MLFGWPNFKATIQPPTHLQWHLHGLRRLELLKKGMELLPAIRSEMMITSIWKTMYKHLWQGVQELELEVKASILRIQTAVDMFPTVTFFEYS